MSMVTWKKIVAWMVGTIVVIGCGGVAATLYFLSADDGMCATIVIDSFPSPDGKAKAVLYQIDCGATTGFNSHVSILSGNSNVLKKNSMPQSFFAADGNKAPVGKAGGPDVRISWLKNDRLEIQHHQDARVIRAKSKEKGVAIDYKQYR